MVLPAATDFLDYIFMFPSQGAFQGDPVILALQGPPGPWSPGFSPGWGPLGGGTIPGGLPAGVPLLIYNPVETLNSPAVTPNALVLLPQQANSTVALPGFWVMITIQGFPGVGPLTAHPNLQILNDRTLMFARQPSVITTKIDVTHINIVINIFGVYVADGLKTLTLGLLLESGAPFLLEDGTDVLLLET